MCLSVFLLPVYVASHLFITLHMNKTLKYQE